MSEEGIDDVVEGLLRQSLTAASQLAEQMARARQRYLRTAEQQNERAAMEAQRGIAAGRAAMRALVLPATRDEWWATAEPGQITQAHLMAQAWKDHDPDALAAAGKINAEVKQRYGIDTADAQGDGAYLQDRLAVVRMAEEQRRVAKEHAEAMALVAAARAEENRRRAAELHAQMERHQVPAEYLANDELVAALQAARAAEGTEAAPEAERGVAERMHLIAKDGIDGPTIEALRGEIGQNYPGVEESHFADAAFVAAARDWHEAKTLAEGGFVDKGNTALQARYEKAEKEFFARLAPMGRDIEDKVLRDPRDRAARPAGPAGPVPAGKATEPAYGSAAHYRRFEESLQGTASEGEIKGRMAAARGQARHPGEAVKQPAKAPKARKAAAGTGVRRDRAQEGPAR